MYPILGHEWTYVEEQVRLCKGIEQWNNVVQFSRVSGSWRTIHERSGERALPVWRLRRE